MKLGEIKYSEITEAEKEAFCLLWQRRHKRNPKDALRILERREIGDTLRDIGKDIGIGPAAVRVVIWYAETLIGRIRNTNPL